jgi:hypothetical protein
MDILFLVSRIVHVGFGVFWAGTMIFNAIFLFPAMRDAGPGGAAVATGLIKRKMTNALPLAAALTILSGFFLYWRLGRLSAGAFGGSRAGMTYGIGALAALVAAILGTSMMRPWMMRAGRLAQFAASAAPAERDKMLAEAQGLRAKVGKVGVIVAWLLGAAVVTMAVARYM